jgi:RNA polymerase II subunit A small phosphatase-like protein
MSETRAQRPLLVLDLDETLVHAEEKGKPFLGRSPDFTTSDYVVYKRPHLDEFLSRMWKLYDIAVWSAAGTLYVNRVVEVIFAGQKQPVFVFSGTRTTRRFDHDRHEAYYIKDLKKVRKRGFDLRRVLIADDLELNAQRNYGNAIYVKEFNGEADDNELLLLADYLEKLADKPDFRTIEKRYWRSAVLKAGNAAPAEPADPAVSAKPADCAAPPHPE